MSDMGDMSGMGGMDMGTNLFQSTNMSMARIFWYMIAATVGLSAACRFVFLWEARQRYVGADSHVKQPDVISVTDGSVLKITHGVKAISRVPYAGHDSLSAHLGLAHGRRARS
jgi:hypothetical protein